MFECFHCGQRAVIWESDFDTEDYGLTSGGIVHELHCANRGAQITYVLLPEEEKDE